MGQAYIFSAANFSAIFLWEDSGFFIGINWKQEGFPEQMPE